MKTMLLSLAFIGLAKQCSRIDTYQMLDKIQHPDYVHKMELTLATDLNADDTAVAGWANRFLTAFERGFKAYQPDIKVIEKLKDYSQDIQVKVIGGNWCSDTHEQVPRLCKVLFYMGVPVAEFEYYRVDRNKKPLEVDFTADRTIGSIPDMIFYINGKEAGRIIETPQNTIEKDLLAILKK